MINHGNKRTFGNVYPTLGPYIMLSPRLEETKMRIVSLFTLSIHAVSKRSFVSCLAVIQGILVRLAHSFAWSNLPYGSMKSTDRWE